MNFRIVFNPGNSIILQILFLTICAQTFAHHTGYTYYMDALNKITGDTQNTQQMPVLFLGHGSPMNAIEENEFVQGFRDISLDIEKPEAYETYG